MTHNHSASRVGWASVTRLTSCSTSYISQEAQGTAELLLVCYRRQQAGRGCWLHSEPAAGHGCTSGVVVEALAMLSGARSGGPKRGSRRASRHRQCITPATRRCSADVRLLSRRGRATSDAAAPPVPAGAGTTDGSTAGELASVRLHRWSCEARRTAGSRGRVRRTAREDPKAAAQRARAEASRGLAFARLLQAAPT
jgi:hypothetical protein